MQVMRDFTHWYTKITIETSFLLAFDERIPRGVDIDNRHLKSSMRLFLLVLTERRLVSPIPSLNAPSSFTYLIHLLQELTVILFHNTHFLGVHKHFKWDPCSPDHYNNLEVSCHQQQCRYSHTYRSFWLQVLSHKRCFW
jgi:hypothetical protein